ncbi:NERD domain-containing protein [Psychrobacter sp. FBL11]|uniref:NERD domain-containing protein n=1 Tax=Psychrobacter saeujeotis TaxID=3143436 RepID=A0ABU9X765_9GAMM|nr:NERD domain-containing protein [uncultured Psychrobacter sp.]
MLEVRRGSAVRSYENTFFREFAKNLSELFNKYNLEGVLLGNSQCIHSENLQIDALLVVKNTVCIIDFKNFEGTIELPLSESFATEIWTNESNDMIKGGSHINPYKQLFQQKKALTWVYHNSKLKTDLGKRFNPSHTKKIVCFHNPITLNGNIPPKDEIDFFIAHKENYLEIIKDVIDVIDEEIDLNKEAFEIFKDIFEAEPFSLTESYDKPTSEPPITEQTENDSSTLLPSQIKALDIAEQFLNNKEENVLILQGPVSSGKSYLTDFIKELAFKFGFLQVEYLAPTYKVIKNLLGDCEDFNSLYSYIYGGKCKKVTNDSDNTDDSDTTTLEIVPIKECHDDDNTLYIVEEAHLVSNGFSQSFNKQFGSGRLLADFIEFLKLSESNRKVIFIGDTYHISSGSKDESSLNVDFYEPHYGFRPKIFKIPLSQDIYAENLIIKDLVSSIDSQSFNNLTIDNSYGVSLLNKKEVSYKDKLVGLIKENLDSNFKILSYSNKACHQVNGWIKKSILNNGSDLAIDDLLLINNNFNAPILGETPNRNKRVFNGDFAWVDYIDSVKTEIVPIQNKTPVTLKFRELHLRHCDSWQIFSVYSLENYREDELLDEEKLALTILVNIKLNEYMKQYPFNGSEAELKMFVSEEYRTQKNSVAKLETALENKERVKTKLEKEKTELRKIERKYKNIHKENISKELASNSSSDYFKYLNCVFLRFGWCMTVHKSLPYKWQHILFDANPANRGIVNEAYFSWLYSGLTRSTNKITLINFTTITPFYKADIVDRSDAQTHALPYLIIDNSIEMAESDELPLNDNDFKSTIVQLYRFVEKLVNSENLDITSVTHNNYQEVFQITDGINSSKIVFWYNKKGIIKYQDPAGNSADLNKTISDLLLNYEGLKDFDSLNLDWRADCYKLLNNKLSKCGYFMHWINSTNFKDIVKIANTESFVGVEFNYDSDGLFSKINITTSSDQYIKNTIVTVLHSFKI